MNRNPIIADLTLRHYRYNAGQIVRAIRRWPSSATRSKLQFWLRQFSRVAGLAPGWPVAQFHPHPTTSFKRCAQSRSVWRSCLGQDPLPHARPAQHRPQRM